MIPAALLCCFGLLVIASAAPQLLITQLISIGFGVAIVVLLSYIDIRPLLRHRGLVVSIYIVAIALLIITLVAAPKIRGTRGWLVVGPLQFQTAEYAKVALITILSYFLAKRHIGIGHLGNVLVPIVYTALPLFLILLQPDLGSGLVIMGLAVGYLFVSGIRPQHVIVGLLLLSVVGFWGWNNFLKEYQRERIVGLFYPERDPLGINYNVIQSKIAIGSGGFWGKGFRQGTQVQLGFLPEAQNDFAFAALIEEWGLFGGIIVLGIFAWLIMHILQIGLAAQDNTARLYCLGVVIFLLLHFALNVGSAVGVLPVVGIPLPFISYGGSNIVVSFLLIGILQNIATRGGF